MEAVASTGQFGSAASSASRERVRQIEANGLRELRHPSCSERLRDFYV